MKKLKVIKDFSHGGEDFKQGERIEIDDDSFAVEMAEKGNVEADVKISKAAATEDEKAATLTKADVDELVNKAVSEVGGKVKRPGVVSVTKERFVDDPKKGFNRSNDFLSEVLSVHRGGKSLDDRMKFLQVQTKTVGADENMENADPFGGFLLPIQFMPELLKISPEADPMAGKTRAIPMSSPTVKIPARNDKNHTTSVSGGFTVTRREEVGTIATSRVDLEQVTLEAHSQFGFSFATEELLNDSPISFTSLVATSFGEEFTSALIDERINGTGVGQYLGVLNSPALVSIAAEAGQEPTSLVYENIIKMRSRAWGYNDAIWLANHDTMPQLMLMNQSVGTGGIPVWQPSGREDHPDLLLGRPIVFTEYTKTLGTVGDLILSNWTQYLEGTLQPLQSAESMHVRFVNHERAFKFWQRNDGRPWWRVPLTPKNSLNTLSPFVVLATRA